MTHERLLYLAHMVDRVNREVNATASIEYCKSCSIHITMFHGSETVSRMFDEYDGDNNRYFDITFGDAELVKAEAFMRMLLNSAKAYPPMRAII